MEIRKARIDDIEAVERIYNKILDTANNTGWIRGVYPTKQTAEDALAADELFVMEKDGEIVAAAKINSEEVKEYELADWKFADAPKDEMMVLHTLVVSPDCGGQGLGTIFVKFYEDYAKENSCSFLRMDTNKNNTAARTLYKKLGYAEVGIVPCNFNGIDDVELVCLEKKI